MVNEETILLSFLCQRARALACIIGIDSLASSLRNLHVLSLVLSNAVVGSTLMSTAVAVAIAIRIHIGIVSSIIIVNVNCIFVIIVRFEEGGIAPHRAISSTSWLASQTLGNEGEIRSIRCILGEALDNQLG